LNFSLAGSGVRHGLGDLELKPACDVDAAGLGDRLGGRGEPLDLLEDGVASAMSTG
jgi:hypothetical protein